jgi:hypothetical protein
MITISLRHNFPDVIKQLDRLADDVGNKVMARAMNRTIDQGKGEMAKQISRTFRISRAEALDRLHVSKVATRGRGVSLKATLSAANKGKARSMNMIKFIMGGVPRRPKRGAMRQLKFKIRRDGGNKSIPGAFVANNGRTVFIRTGKERKPIKALSTIDIPQMFNTREINKVVRDVMQERFGANFKRELRAVLRGFAK